MEGKVKRAGRMKGNSSMKIPVFQIEFESEAILLSRESKSVALPSRGIQWGETVALTARPTGKGEEAFDAKVATTKRRVL